MVKRRGNVWHIRFRFKKREVWATTQASLKREAERIERAVKYAIRTGDYHRLDSESRSVCIRIFKNREWEIPQTLINPVARNRILEPVISQELTLWRGIELCLKYPEIRDSQNRERLEQCFIHLIDKIGKDFPVKKIHIPEIKQYRIERLNEGASESTVNKEKSALSKMFQVLVELQHITINPARQVRDLSEKSGERQAYIGLGDYLRIVNQLPLWLQPIIQTAFHTGMRRGEIISLTVKRVKLSRRIILIGPENTKEGQWKRIPIHRELLPILEEVIKIRSLKTDKLFLVEGRSPNPDSIKNPWNKAVSNIGLDPAPRFHDLRHTWKTNARRSGMDPEIREAIMGHGDRTRNVRERYGAISDQELIKAIDLMTFDHGQTEIWLSKETFRNSSG